MKAKYIYEKFEEDSDPIEDLGIGAKSSINDIIKKKWPDLTYDNVNISSLIILLYNINRPSLINFLIKDKKIDIELKYSEKWAYILANAAFEKQWDVAKYLINIGANLKDTIKYSEECNLVITNKRLKYLKNLLLKDKKIKESINEKFVEDSDPIHDLGIGNIIKNKIYDEKQLKQIFPKSKFIENRINMSLFKLFEDNNFKYIAYVFHPPYSYARKPYFMGDFDTSKFYFTQINKVNKETNEIDIVWRANNY